jgi:murein DD-endopeptidase MepM/ murein hydrolase activator NlpD
VTVEKSGDLGLVAVVEGYELMSRYAHLSAIEGKTSVLRGEKLGECGNTGRLTTGPHLHFEVENI